MRKAEYRTHKNEVYFLWSTSKGWIFFIRDLEVGSEPFEQKEDAMSEARKQIETAKLEKKFRKR